MADIRLARQNGPRVWLWIGLLAMIGLALWSTAFFVGDATDPDEPPRVGAAADFGALRAPVLPAQAVPLEALDPLQTRDLGRLVHVSGVAQSSVRGNALWVRSNDGRRILLRFEPAPDPELLRSAVSGGSVELDGYLNKIAEAEFYVWMDSLRVSVPRPPPGRKFGDLPDPNFARVDSLFVKDYYVSVRPEALRAGESADAAG